jgi:hypothetical protein
MTDTGEAASEQTKPSLWRRLARQAAFGAAGAAGSSAVTWLLWWLQSR